MEFMGAYRAKPSSVILVLVLGTAAIIIGCHGENVSTIDVVNPTEVYRTFSTIYMDDISSGVLTSELSTTPTPTLHTSAFLSDGSGSGGATVPTVHSQLIETLTSSSFTSPLSSTLYSTDKSPSVQVSIPLVQTTTTATSIPQTTTLSISSSTLLTPLSSQLPTNTPPISSSVTTVELTSTRSLSALSAPTSAPPPTDTSPSSTPFPRTTPHISILPSTGTPHTSTPPPTSTPAPTSTETVGSAPSSPTLNTRLSPASDRMTASLTTTPTPSAMTSNIATTGDENIADKIEAFFETVVERTEILVSLILGSVAIILLVFLACVGCYCLYSCRKRNRKNFNLTSQASATRNGVSPTYRPRSRMSNHEMSQFENDAFYSDHRFQTSSQPYYSTTAVTDSAFGDPLPTISPLSYPSQLRNYINPDKQERLTSPTPRVSLSGSPGHLRRFPGGSPSLHHPTPLGQQLKKQAEKNSMQGSRNSMQGSRASISAMGSRTSFSGSRNSFLSGSNTMSRDEMRSSGFLMASSKTMSEEETSSLLSSGPVLRRTSLDMVPTRQSPIQPTSGHPSKRRECRSMTCIPNPLALQGEEEMEGREESFAEDENDLRTDPLVPVMTSTPANQREEDFPTREVTQRKKTDEPQKSDSSRDASVLTSPRRRNLQQLTSLTHREEGGETPGESAAVLPSSGTVGGVRGDGEIVTPKEDTLKPKPMSRLEKLTSLNYIRSSIRRSLKKKKVSFLTRTPPETTPKAKKKTPPHNLPGVKSDLDPDPDPLTFSNQGAFDSDEPRIHTPSPLSPEFEGVDEYPQRYPDDFHNPDVYPETPVLHHPYPGMGGGRMRAYSDLPMFVPQLSQPTYYPSTMHYPQPSYPQLSQQYVPPSYAPQPVSFVGSPTHRSFGPLHQQPALHPPPHPTEPYGRRYTADPIASNPRVGGGRGGSEQTSTDPHKGNRTRSPDTFTDNISSRFNYGTSPDRYTETSNISDFHVLSPDVYAGLVPGRDGYHDPPLRFRSNPTSPEDRPYSPQYHPLPGGGRQYKDHSATRSQQYTERSIDDPRTGNARQGGTNSQMQSPTHHPPHSGQYRRSSIEHHPSHSRHGSNDTTGNHIRRGSIETTGNHIRRGSIETTGRRGTNDNTGNHVRRGSNDMTGNHVRQSSNEAAANHVRRGSNDMTGNQIRRGSVDTEPPIAGHIRRSSIDTQPANTGSHFRHGYQPSGSARRSSIDSYHGAQNISGFQTILEPEPQRNGIESDEVWQYSQRDEPSMQYGMGSQHGLPVWDDPIRGHEPKERAVDSSTSNAKTKVSWNNEIIEHIRTPSDCSDGCDL